MRRKNPALDKLMIISRIETILDRLYSATSCYVFEDMLKRTRRLPANVSDDDLVSYFNRLLYVEYVGGSICTIDELEFLSQPGMREWKLGISGFVLAAFGYKIVNKPTEEFHVPIHALEELRELWLLLWNTTCNRKLDRVKLDRNITSFGKIVRQAASRFYPSPVPVNVSHLVDATNLILNARIDYETLAEILEITIRSHGNLLPNLTKSYTSGLSPHHLLAQRLLTDAEFAKGLDNLVEVSDIIFPIKSKMAYAVPILMATKALLGYQSPDYYCDIEGLV